MPPCCHWYSISIQGVKTLDTSDLDKLVAIYRIQALSLSSKTKVFETYRWVKPKTYQQMDKINVNNNKK